MIVRTRRLHNVYNLVDNACVGRFTGHGCGILCEKRFGDDPESLIPDGLRDTFSPPDYDSVR